MRVTLSAQEMIVKIIKENIMPVPQQGEITDKSR